MIVLLHRRHRLTDYGRQVVDLELRLIHALHQTKSAAAVSRHELQGAVASAVPDGGHHSRPVHFWSILTRTKRERSVVQDC